MFSENAVSYFTVRNYEHIVRCNLEERAGVLSDPLDDLHWGHLGFPRIRIAAVGRPVIAGGVRHGGFIAAVASTLLLVRRARTDFAAIDPLASRVGYACFGRMGEDATHDPP